MSKYNKHVWRVGEVISAELLNAVENQLEMITPGATTIADEYNLSTTYEVGDYCLYNGGLWRCIAQSTGNAPEEGMYWTNTTLVEELNNGVDASIASAYSTTKTYHINDYVIYDNKLYRNIYNGTTSGSWNSDKWEETILTDDVTDALDAIDGLGSAALDTAYEALAAATSAIDEVEALTSDIADAIASIPSDYDDLLATLATDFSAGTYTAGQYVWYNGTLYRFTADHSGSWTGTDVETVVIGNELTGLKNALNVINSTEKSQTNCYEIGTLSTGNGANTNSTTRVRNKSYQTLSDIYSITAADGYSYSFRFYSTASYTQYLGYTDWLTGSTVVNTVAPNGANYYRLIIRHNDDATITDASEFEGKIHVFEYLSSTVNVMKNQLVETNKTNTNKKYDYELGTINASTGAELTATNRIRTKDFIPIESIIRIACDEGYEYALRVYGQDKSTILVQTANWISTEITYNQIITSISSNTKYIRIIARISDDSTITNAEYVANHIHIYGYVGALIDDIRKEINDTHDEIRKIGKATYSLKPWFEQGSLTTSTGGNQNVANRIRSGFLEYAPESVYVHIGEGIKYSWRSYRDGSYVGSSDWIETSGYLSITSGCNMARLVVAYTDNSNITPSDNIDFTVSGEVEKISSDITYASNTLGNVTVCAAKTINFSDGTPPKLDWYLLMSSTDNRFYMSKDLTNKDYLFTFVPPQGAPADWSVGITKDNDILFVINAAGLSDTNGRLNDANRINPVCYLASENYTTQHIIDFGNDLKPCGWLENVGYCVLPNGNIIIAEYTRGTVKTANVWLITGDIMDKTNWSVKWSTDIIDTLDVTSVGVKHCHEVQYDFYTGTVYFGTGDSPTGSFSYYSTDGGATWELLYGPDKDRCRRLTYVFTQDKVYWASDSFEANYHHFFITERDENGIIDVENATQIALNSTNGQACYGCVYLASLNMVVMMDRQDTVLSDKLYWYAYDIDSESIIQIGIIGAATGDGTKYLGFRCRFVDWYPIHDTIMVGFDPVSTSAMASINQNALLGNVGNSGFPDGRHINNMLLSVYKHTGTYGFRADTLYL